MSEHGVRALTVAVCAAAAITSACTGTDQAMLAGNGRSPTVATTAGSLPADDRVDVGVYLRHPVEDRLLRVTREVPMDGDLLRSALEQLVAGADDRDGLPLRPALPTTTAVNDVTVDGGVASVVLSHDAVPDGAIGRSASDEVLALAAIVNTLTEFPSIDGVRLSIDGDPDGMFWGSWGIPGMLVRDETVVGDDARGPVDLADFRSAEQTIGNPATVAHLASVRVRDRITYRRIVLELDDVSGDAVPRARAVPDTAGVTLVLRGITDTADEVVLGADLPAGRDGLATVRVDEDAAPNTLRIVVRTGGPGTFHLFTMSDPTRIVLDVRK